MVKVKDKGYCNFTQIKCLRSRTVKTKAEKARLLLPVPPADEKDVAAAPEILKAP